MFPKAQNFLSSHYCVWCCWKYRSFLKLFFPPTPCEGMSLVWCMVVLPPFSPFQAWPQALHPRNVTLVYSRPTIVWWHFGWMVFGFCRHWRSCFFVHFSLLGTLGFFPTSCSSRDKLSPCCCQEMLPTLPPWDRVPYEPLKCSPCPFPTS